MLSSAWDGTARTPHEKTSADVTRVVTPPLPPRHERLRLEIRDVGLFSQENVAEYSLSTRVAPTVRYLGGDPIVAASRICSARGHQEGPTMQARTSRPNFNDTQMLSLSDVPWHLQSGGDLEPSSSTLPAVRALPLVSPSPIRQDHVCREYIHGLFL